MKIAYPAVLPEGQRSQNKDSLALQLKLNEIVSALDGASNRLVNIEDLTEAELDDGQTGR